MYSDLFPSQKPIFFSPVTLSAVPQQTNRVTLMFRGGRNDPSVIPVVVVDAKRVCLCGCVKLCLWAYSIRAPRTSNRTYFQRALLPSGFFLWVGEEVGLSWELFGTKVIYSTVCLFNALLCNKLIKVHTLIGTASSIHLVSTAWKVCEPTRAHSLLEMKEKMVVKSSSRTFDSSPDFKYTKLFIVYQSLTHRR